MKTKRIRNVVFQLHRYIGLFVGLITVVVGLTGSLLVFRQEIDRVLVRSQFGEVVPQQSLITPTELLETVSTTLRDRHLILDSLSIPLTTNAPYAVWLKSIDEKWTEVFINPYTGVILGTRQWENSLYDVVYRLHYQLLAGDIGLTVVGIVAFLLLLLCITGIILWSGWKKLINGFKIKWKAHPQRVSFDVHKVIGIVTALFLAMIAFTGFCWNFAVFTQPIIYALTQTPQLAEPTSTPPTTPKSPVTLNEVLIKADAVLPGAVTTNISLPSTPEGIFRISKKFPHEKGYGRSEVYLDQYTGDILRVRDARALPLAEAILNVFALVHHGTFGGWLTRFFYVFVGLAPTILMVTGFVMWWSKKIKLPSKHNHESSS
ncbi:PepSY-associated TM helix domain-containing protein [Chroogloeocystis siderophila]|uniref:Peptidase n=1 Tax=Chroogloeocystis siderophila 5.2 s.c.1 TaxID=247279 RepID=A0A1U7HYW1_9CHRO|nr:PepSY-associated TM helix domain-containing protein [Chroogloeocystis siderophila]OKH28770.1 peptidase [Chroogloeocystis siderophila 5.2 s.c.1]